MMKKITVIALALVVGVDSCKWSLCMVGRLWNGLWCRHER